MKYYAKSNPKETIMEHTNKLLENLKLLKNIYEKDIAKNENFDEKRFWYLLEIICKYHDIGKVYTPFQNMILDKLKQQTIPTKFSNEIKHEQLSPMFIPIKKYSLSEDEKRLVYQAIYYHHERDYKDINNTYVQEILEEDILPKLDKIKSEIPVEIEENINCMYIKYIQNRNRIKEYDPLFIEYCLLKGILHRLDYCSSANIEVEENIVENVADYVNVFMENKKKMLYKSFVKKIRLIIYW